MSDFNLSGEQCAAIAQALPIFMLILVVDRKRISSFAPHSRLWTVVLGVVALSLGLATIQAVLGVGDGLDGKLAAAVFGVFVVGGGAVMYAVFALMTRAHQE